MTAETGYDLALPGTWWEVPVDDEADTERAIDTLVLSTVGRRDEDAAARRDLRTRFRTAATRARSAGAIRLHLCRELMPGVPLPASLTVYRPRIPLRPGEAPGPLAQLEAVVEPAEGADDVVIEVAVGEALRRVREVAADDGSPEAGITTLRVDYWVVPPSRRPLLLSFTCGLVGLRAELLGLFDLVVATLSFSGVRETP